MMLLLLGGLILLATILTYTYLKQHYTRSINDPPGTEPQILFGNLMDSGLLMGKTTFHEVMIDYQRRHGDKFIFWLGSHPCIAFCLPKHAQTIFSDRHTFEHSPLVTANTDLHFPNGIFVLSGVKWKRHSRVMLPMLKRAKMILYLDTLVEYVDRFTDQYLIDNHVHTDLKVCCQSLMMNIIGWIGFNYDLDVTMNSSLKKAFEYIISQTSLFMTNIWIPRSLIKIYLKLDWKYQRAYQLIQELTNKIVEHEQNNQNTMENQQPKSLIASLISSLNEQANDQQISSGLTRAEMLDEILAFFLAGYDSPSSALTWFIFYMSKNLRVQERIQAELREHHLLMMDGIECLPSLTQEKLDSLVYCDCVTKEVLRLAPVAGLTMRMALHDTIVDNTHIRRGQSVIIAIQNINTDGRYWHHADPSKFVPERFLGDDKNHHPYAMLSFGGGHRACPGKDLGWFQLKTVIVRLMQRGVIFEDTPENTGGYEEEVACYPKKLAVRVRINRQ